MNFHEFIARLNLRNFTAEEILIGTGREGNRIPARELWPNIVPTLLVLDEVRDRFMCPVTITSCYRAPEYNRRIGGKRLSQHQAFRAIDFVVSRTDPSEVQALLRHWRGAHFESPVVIEHHAVPIGADFIPSIPLQGERGFFFAGGVGCYETFTHLDTRGVNADWKG